jgi:hypothetical protein
MRVRLRLSRNFTNYPMNKIILTLLVGLCFHSADAQTWNEWFRQKKTQKKYLIQQIAALQMYLKYLKEGYDIAKKGLNVIGDIKQGKFDLDQDYLGSLRTINSSISGSGKISSVIAYHKLLIRQLEKLEDESNDCDLLTPSEKSYVSTVYANMVRESEKALEDLERILTDDQLEMKDDERIKQLDKIYIDTKDMYMFSRSFCNSTRMLISQRSLDSSEIENQEQLIND